MHFSRSQTVSLLNVAVCSVPFHIFYFCHSLYRSLVYVVYIRKHHPSPFCILSRVAGKHYSSASMSNEICVHEHRKHTHTHPKSQTMNNFHLNFIDAIRFWFSRTLNENVYMHIQKGRELRSEREGEREKGRTRMYLLIIWNMQLQQSILFLSSIIIAIVFSCSPRLSLSLSLSATYLLYWPCDIQVVSQWIFY